MTLLAAVLAGAFQAKSLEQPFLVVRSFREFRKCVKDSKFTYDVSPQVDFAPLVVSSGTWNLTDQEFQRLCKRLGLKCIVNEKQSTVFIAPKESEEKERAIREGVVWMQRLLGPYKDMTPKQIWAAAKKLEESSRLEHASTESVQDADYKAFILRTLAQTHTAIAMQPLFGDSENLIKAFKKPWSQGAANQPSKRSLSLMSQVINRRSVSELDLEPETSGNEERYILAKKNDEVMWEEQRKVLLNEPILRHRFSLWMSHLYFMATAYGPKSVYEFDWFILNISKYLNSKICPLANNILDVEFSPNEFLQGFPVMSFNSLCSVAKKINLHTVSWLDFHFDNLEKRDLPKATLRRFINNAANLDIQIVDNILSLRRVSRDSPPIPCKTNTVFEFFSLFQERVPSFVELERYFTSLTAEDHDMLQIFALEGALPWRMQEAISNSRVLSAYFSCRSTNPSKYEWKADELTSAAIGLLQRHKFSRYVMETDFSFVHPRVFSRWTPIRLWGSYWKDGMSVTAYYGQNSTDKDPKEFGVYLPIRGYN